MSRPLRLEFSGALYHVTLQRILSMSCPNYFTLSNNESDIPVCLAKFIDKPL